MQAWLGGMYRLQHRAWHRSCCGGVLVVNPTFNALSDCFRLVWILLPNLLHTGKVISLEVVVSWLV